MRYWFLALVVAGTPRHDASLRVAAFTAPQTTARPSLLPRTPPGRACGRKRRGRPLGADVAATSDAQVSLGLGLSSSSSSSSAGRYGLAALSTRAQRLRELLLNKEILNDLTEAEFALTLAQSFEAAGDAGGSAGGGSLLGGFPGSAASAFGASAAERRGASSIDFETLLGKLARHDASLEERLASLPARNSDDLPGSASTSSPTVFAGLSAGQLAALAARVHELSEGVRAVMARRDRARQAAALAAAARARADAQAEAEALAAEAWSADAGGGGASGGGGSRGSSGGAGLGLLRRNKNFEALFPSARRQVAQKRLDDIKSFVKRPAEGAAAAASAAGQTADEAAAAGSPRSSSAAAAAQAVASSSSSSVEELVESMVANPSGAPKAMKQQFAVFVREDGTVDFDKAVETGKEVRACSSKTASPFTLPGSASMGVCAWRKRLSPDQACAKRELLCGGCVDVFNRRRCGGCMCGFACAFSRHTAQYDKN
jgi:hypothetical protein